MSLDDFADAIVNGKIESGQIDPQKVDLISYKDDLLLELQSANSGISTTETIAEITLPERLHGADSVGVRESNAFDKQAHSNVAFQIAHYQTPTSPEPTKKPRSRTMGM